MKGSRRLWIEPFAAALVLALAVVLWFWPIAVTNRILAGTDSFNFFAPYWDYAAQGMQQGRLPLWSPDIFLGVPFLANPPSALIYPFFWPFRWLLSPPKAILAAYLWHAWLGGVLTVAYARRSLGLRFSSALLAGLAWAGSGYVGGQAEHVSHLSAAAWLPGMFLLLDAASGWRPRRDIPQGRTVLVAVLLLALAIAFTLLTGHAQFAYVGLFATGLYALWPSAQRSWFCWRDTKKLTLDVAGVSRLLVFTIAAILGFLLAAVQMLPTWELASLSARAGGLSYREVVSFSLPPRTLLFSFLPAYGQSLEAAFSTPAFTEFVAYLGVVIVGLTLAAIIGRHRSRPRPGFLILLAIVGVALALGVFNPLNFLLYKLVPGFAWFRTPARWLSLYTLGMALLAGIGLETICDSSWRGPRFSRRMLWIAVPVLLTIIFWLRRPGWEAWLGWAAAGFGLLGIIILARRFSRIAAIVPSFIIVIVVAELYVGARTLPHAHPTAPEAASSLRTSTAALLMKEGLGRTLSMSSLTFDPGDLRQQQHLYAGQLSSSEFYDLMVATKLKEVLAPNLSMLYQIPSVDGYDGGLLPLPTYVMLVRLLLPEGEVAPDGRLREKLQELPPRRLLDLLNIRFIITDKLHDLWLDDVYYDLQQRAVLSPSGSSETTGKPDALLSATAIGIVSHLQGSERLSDGTPVGELILVDESGREERLTLKVGVDTAEGVYSDQVLHQQARTARTWPDSSSGLDYITVLHFADGPMTPVQVRLRLQTDAATWVIRGLSLIDERTGTHRPVLASTEQTLERIHSGDVKVYEVEDVLPRAYAVNKARVMQNDEATLAALADADFEPATEVLLAEGELLDGPSYSNEVDIVAYAPERVVIQTQMAEQGYLVLSDTHYPGWRATVDGRESTIVRANLLFRAVFLPAGEHEVIFSYAPSSLRWGGAVSLATLLVIVLLMTVSLILRYTKRSGFGR